jgi:hypothetical protein
VEEKYIQTLIETETRSKNNSHRLDELESDVKNNNTLALNVRELTIEIKHMREDYQKLAETHAKEVQAIDNRLSEVERKPAKRYEQVVSLIITGIVTTVLGVLLGKFGL